MANKLYTTIMIALVGFALTAQQTAFATNESSYKIGLKYGHDEYHECYTAHSCGTSVNYYSLRCEDSSIIDNRTACEDGYTHGWISECLIDGGGGACKPQPNPATYTYAKCIAAGYHWHADGCQVGKLVGITGPTVCHRTSEGQTCESGSVAGSGWIPVKYINHTAPDRLTPRPSD